MWEVAQDHGSPHTYNVPLRYSTFTLEIPKPVHCGQSTVTFFLSMLLISFFMTTVLAAVALAACGGAPAQAPLTPVIASNGTGVKLAGVNIAGMDFGCDTNGTCTMSGVYPAPNAAQQMQHFVRDNGLNIFRLPVAWQYLVNNVCGGKLNSANFGVFDKEMRSCLATGAYCIIDIHNYARWDGGIIGQGGPTDQQFSSLWAQLAQAYANQSKVMFGIVNEPHDIPDMARWAQSVQVSVTAIRNAGAVSQYILLPGTNYTGAQNFIKDESLAVLNDVKNPDGSTTNLIMDVHQYLDGDGSGTSTECIKNNIDTAFRPLAQALRNLNRTAILSETGGGNTQSCITNVCQEIAFLK